MREDDFELTFDLDPPPRRTMSLPLRPLQSRPPPQRRPRQSRQQSLCPRPARNRRRLLRQPGTRRAGACWYRAGTAGSAPLRPRAFYQAGYRVAVLYHTNAQAAADLEASLPGCVAAAMRCGQPPCL